MYYFCSGLIVTDLCSLSCFLIDVLGLLFVAVTLTLWNVWCVFHWCYLSIRHIHPPSTNIHHGHIRHKGAAGVLHFLV